MPAEIADSDDDSDSHEYAPALANNDQINPEVLSALRSSAATCSTDPNLFQRVLQEQDDAVKHLMRHDEAIYSRHLNASPDLIASLQSRGPNESDHSRLAVDKADDLTENTFIEPGCGTQDDLQPISNNGIYDANMWDVPSSPDLVVAKRPSRRKRERAPDSFDEPQNTSNGSPFEKKRRNSNTIVVHEKSPKISTTTISRSIVVVPRKLSEEQRLSYQSVDIPLSDPPPYPTQLHLVATDTLQTSSGAATNINTPRKELNKELQLASLTSDHRDAKTPIKSRRASRNASTLAAVADETSPTASTPKRTPELSPNIEDDHAIHHNAKFDEKTSSPTLVVAHNTNGQIQSKSKRKPGRRGRLKKELLEDEIEVVNARVDFEETNTSSSPIVETWKKPRGRSKRSNKDTSKQKPIEVEVLVKEATKGSKDSRVLADSEDDEDDGNYEEQSEAAGEPEHQTINEEASETNTKTVQPKTSPNKKTSQEPVVSILNQAHRPAVLPTADKPIFRVGLSKRHRMPSLLKMVPRNP